jgi:type IV secretory pathway VirB10-like protein
LNTFWTKLAGLTVVVIVLVVLVTKFSKPRDKPKPKPKTFQQVIAEDDKRLRAEPKLEDIKQPQQPAPTEPEPKPLPTEQKPPPTPRFEQLSEVQEIEAERLFEFAIQQRKIGRLPAMSFKPMVDACREIIQRFPGSEFDYKARRMFAEIPQRYRERYKVTEEETDLTRFFE